LWQRKNGPLHTRTGDERRKTFFLRAAEDPPGAGVWEILSLPKVVGGAEKGDTSARYAQNINIEGNRVFNKRSERLAQETNSSEPWNYKDTKKKIE